MTKAEIQKKITEIRHHIHMHPELALEEHETSDYIASILEELGLEVTRGIGGCSGNADCGDRGKDDRAAGGYGRPAHCRAERPSL